MKNFSDSGAAQAGTGAVDYRRWRRVSSIATAYFAFDTIKRSINLWPALVGVWAGGETIQALFWDYGIYLLAVLFFLSVFLEYWFFRFREEEDRIQLQRGVFRRKRLTLYYDRVQQADISQPYYFRPFGLATLGLESAGSAQKEVDLPGLPFAEAEELKTKILDYQKFSAGTGEEKSAAENAGAPMETEPLYKLNLPASELARYGLMHNGLLFLLPLSAPFWQHFDIYAVHLESYFENSEFLARVIEFMQGGTAFLIAIAILLSLISGLISLFALSVLIALVRFWDYQLVGGRDQYQYRAGLLTVKTRGFRLHKLQKVTVAQGLFARWLKRYSLAISKAGGVVMQQQQEGRNFLVPVLDNTRLTQIRAQLKLPDTEWTRVSRFQYWLRGILKGSLFAMLAASLAIALLESPIRAMLAGAMVLVLSMLASRRYWRRFGYFLDENWLVVRSGFIGRKLVYVPAAKIQKIRLSQPPWLKWCGLAHLVIWSGDGTVQVPYLPCTTAAEMRDNILHSVVTFRGRWF